MGTAFGGYGISCTGKQLVPMFPASLPSVTAIGGTTGMYPEKAWSGSGGGFSNRFAQPSWQRNAVKWYLKNNTNTLPKASLFNATGRGIPDISAQATGFYIYKSGLYSGVGGTSCSAPVVSGIFGLLNSARANVGKSPMGFLNPFIYANGNLFNDITSGKNPGCGTNGFSASKGWDPITGYGTPNYEKLLVAALALP